ncbi:MAG: HD domain-containing protein [Candidatus Thorarchaeota archaeon]|nr:HD domain-containing protein [Candidatus Thorarchaeota archaeon]
MRIDSLENLLRSRIEEATNEASREEWLEFQGKTPTSLYNYRFDHVEAVVHLSKHIAKEVGADLEVVTLAAWLHDVAKPGLGGVQRHGEESALVAKQILFEQKMDSGTIERVLDTIRKHVGLTLEHKLEPLEAQVLWDADKIAKLGVIGFIHFIVNGMKLKPGLSLGKLAEELLEFLPLAKNIVGSMNTTVGRKIAEERLNTLVKIVNLIEDEIGIGREL